MDDSLAAASIVGCLFTVFVIVHATTTSIPISVITAVAAALGWGLWITQKGTPNAPV